MKIYAVLWNVRTGQDNCLFKKRNGEDLMTIKEIARLAGVSTSTVSKIVNQKDNSISAETRERVLKIVKEYNYTPYASVASPSQKTWIIGIILRSSTSFDATLDGIVKEAQANGYNTLICSSSSHMDQELKNITAVCKNNVDGIIWEPVCAQSLSLASHIEKKGIPCFTVGPDGGPDAFRLPYEDLGYRLTQELIRLRHENIACLTQPGRRSDAFISGYRKCLFDNQMPFDETLIFSQVGEGLIDPLNTRQITGVISSHYQKALEFYQLMNALHYRIPEDFSLITLKNDKVQALAYPTISSYTVANGAYGSYLCQRLIARIEKKESVPEPFSQEFTLDTAATMGIPAHLKAPKITVVGSINMDTYLNVSRLPNTGKTVSTSTSSVYPGGKGINQAIGAAKLGHRVALIGNVGSDLESDYIYRTLNQYGVDTFGVKRRMNVHTGKAYIMVDPDGNSMISILAGANDTFTPADIQEKEHVFNNTGYCLIQSEVPLDTVFEACTTAHKFHAKTILKPSARSRIPKKTLAQVDIIIPNEDELGELCPGAATLKERADYLLECGVKAVIVTLGEHGCYVKTKTLEKKFPAALFASVDTTGASDAFISALASYLLYGYPLEKAVRIAVYAAGFCVTREGVVPSLIDRNSLETYIRQIESDLL